MPFPSELELRPFDGAGPVRFGMTYDEVVAVLGAPDQALSGLWRSDTKRAGWHKGGGAIHFNSAVSFVEFSRDAGFVVRVAGLDIDLFRTPAEEVVDGLLRRGHPVSSRGPKPGHTYLFKDLQLALWRQVVPEDEHDEEGRYFDTVSLGAAGYYP